MASGMLRTDIVSSIASDIDAVSPTSSIQYKNCQRSDHVVFFSGRFSFSSALSSNEILAKGLPEPISEFDFTAQIPETQKTMRLRVDGSGNIRNGWTSVTTSETAIINVMYFTNS